MTIPTVNPVPVLSRTDPAFRAKMNLFYNSDLPGFAGQLNAVSLAIDALAIVMMGYRNDANASVLAAAGHVTTAGNKVIECQAQVTLAQGHAQDAASYAGAQPFVPGQVYAAKQAAVSSSNGMIYRRISSGAGATDPAIDPTNWTATGVNIATDLGAGTAVNAALGNYFYKAMAGNFTPVISNVPPAPARYGATLEIAYTSGVFNLPAGGYWADGVAPPTTAGKVLILSFSTRNGGTTTRWFCQGQFAA